MQPHTILILDRLAGTPVCALLTFYERVIRRWFRPGAGADIPAPPKKIVFVKLIEMGSTVLAAGAFAEAGRMVGRNHLYFMCFRQNRSIVDLLPYFPQENILTIDDSSLWTFARDLLASIRTLRRHRVDAAVDMEGLTRSSAIITWLTGAGIRAGYHNFTSEGPYRGRLFTHELNYNFQHHVSRMFLALVRALSRPPEQIPLLKEPVTQEEVHLPSFQPEPEDLARVQTLLKQKLGTPLDGPLILLNPNCSDLLPLRQWPQKRFIELGRHILAHLEHASLLITGAPAEQDGAQAIADAIGGPRVTSMAGHTTMRDLLTLYTLSDVLISNDSGPCHFASLTHIAVIALFGPETPVLYSPLGERVQCIRADLACSPCVNMLNHRFSPCNENRCMQAISVAQVFAALEKVLQP